MRSDRRRPELLIPTVDESVLTVGLPVKLDALRLEVLAETEATDLDP